jgi:YidC/Oxa1 family membrane protein insertase
MRRLKMGPFAAAASLFGSLLYWLYGIFGDYGIAIIVFTVAIKLILMPLNIKQIKSSMKTQALQPELKKLQDRYKNDREKLNEEMVKFFKEKNHNPAGGCVGILVQTPILLVIFQVFRNPISNMLKGGEYVLKLFSEMKVVTEAEVIFNYTTEVATRLVSNNTIPLGLSDKILDIQDGMKFLGIFDLAKTPTYQMELLRGEPDVYLPLLLLIATLTIVTFLSAKMMSGVRKNRNNNMDDETSKKMAATNSTLMLLMPVMLAVFSFQVPAALTFYWLIGTVFQIFQQMYINRSSQLEHEKS